MSRVVGAGRNVRSAQRGAQAAQRRDSEATQKGRNARIEIHGAPPSLNAVGARGAAISFHREKKRWQGILEGYLLQATAEGRLARGNRAIVVSGRIEFTANRRRDEGNYRTLLEKALGDALTNGRWLADDTPDSYRFERLELTSGAAQTRTVLVLECS